MAIEDIQSKLTQFAIERDWEKFHTPKNLAMALAVEAAELMEHFQWSNSGGAEEIGDPTTRAEIEDELADVFNYVLRLSDIIDVDIEKAALRKMASNNKKYPIEKSKGNSTKYTKL